MPTQIDYRIERESGGFADVYCRHCGKWIGRLQTHDPTTSNEGDSDAEIRLIVDEHRVVCTHALERAKH